MRPLYWITDNSISVQFVISLPTLVDLLHPDYNPSKSNSNVFRILIMYLLTELINFLALILIQYQIINNITINNI